MFARKCDRCGKLYENYYDKSGNAVYAFTRNDNGEPLDKEVYISDLCPECMEEYQHFMDGWIPMKPIESVPADTDQAAEEPIEFHYAIEYPDMH